MTKEQYVVIKTEELAQKGITYKPFHGGKRQKENSHNKKSKKQKKDVSEPKEVKEEPKEEDRIEKGLLLEIKNVPDTSIGDLKAYFARFGSVQFVDVDKISEQTAIIRFLTSATTDTAYAELSEKKMEIKGNILDGRIVTGEEEENYWKAHILPGLMKGRQRKNSRYSTRGGRGRGKFNNKRQKTKSKPPQTTDAPCTTPAPESSVSNQPAEKVKEPTE